MKIGDVVKLASGGPEMTVEKVYSRLDACAGYVNVVWFDEENHVQTAMFPASTLSTTKITKEEPE